VQFNTEKTNSSNIFGISCVDTSNDVWWNKIIFLHAPWNSASAIIFLITIRTPVCEN
jgi:hypothetical protein